MTTHEIAEKLRFYPFDRERSYSDKHIAFILSRARRPSPELAEALEKITGVSRLAWLYPDEFENPLIKKRVLLAK